MQKNEKETKVGSCYAAHLSNQYAYPYFVSLGTNSAAKTIIVLKTSRTFHLGAKIMLEHILV